MCLDDRCQQCYIYWKEEGTQHKTLRYTNGNLILEEFDKEKLRFILQRYIQNLIIDKLGIYSNKIYNITEYSIAQITRNEPER